MGRKKLAVDVREKLFVLWVVHEGNSNRVKHGMIDLHDITLSRNTIIRTARRENFDAHAMIARQKMMAELGTNVPDVNSMRMVKIGMDMLQFDEMLIKQLKIYMRGDKRARCDIKDLKGAMEVAKFVSLNLTSMTGVDPKRNALEKAADAMGHSIAKDALEILKDAGPEESARVISKLKENILNGSNGTVIEIPAVRR